MKHLLSKVILLILLSVPGMVFADIAVLIHGYHSSGNAWRSKGILQILASNGWNDAGLYTPVLGNVGIPGYTLSNQGNHVVTAELPSEAPVQVQADLLNVYLKDIHKRFDQQQIHLIAHSAGGIIARLALVENKRNLPQQESQNALPIIQLITIATPHLGTPIAEMAEMASDSLLGIVAPYLGAGEINRAEILYSQLSSEKENYFLYWLNRQPHPVMLYTSIIRADSSLLSGDRLVPSYSQNMAFVPAIGPNAQMIMTPGDHKLKSADGFLLIKLLP